MFVVLGATGNTGKVVAETLLAQKKAVRVVLHDAVKREAWKAGGAEVAVANVEDGASLEKAFDGAEGAYVLLPPALSFPHSEAASITGGYVYRGKRLPELVGCYICGDWM